MASDRIQRRIERLLDQIEQEADQRNWQLVLELSKEVLGFAPDNHEGMAVNPLMASTVTSSNILGNQERKP